MSATLVAPRTSLRGDRAALMDAIRDAQRALVTRLIPEVTARGLTAHQFWPLFYLARGAESHPAELARRLGVTKPACTASIDQLVDAGLIVRRRSSSDRRQIVLAPTAKGRRILDAVWAHVDGKIEAATEELSDAEVATAARVLHVVAERLVPSRPAGPRSGEAA